MEINFERYSFPTLTGKDLASALWAALEGRPLVGTYILDFGENSKVGGYRYWGVLNPDPLRIPSTVWNENTKEELESIMNSWGFFDTFHPHHFEDLKRAAEKEGKAWK